MKNFVQEGKTLNLIAPVGGVSSGQGYLLGALFVVAVGTAVAGSLFSAHTCGVVALPVDQTDTFTIGQQVFWEVSSSTVRSAAASGRAPIGCLAEQGDVAAAAKPTVAVRLDGVATVAQA